MRSLYLILSPASLSYARFAMESLWKRSAEPVHLHLITDSIDDRNVLTRFMQELSDPASTHAWSVYAARDIDDREADRFGHFPNLRSFRRGHPCWRKITDPLLLSVPGDEMVLLDPDLYFPNRFRFEATPSTGLLLMWQKPNCLVPRQVVRTAMQAGVPLAHHVDIGVAHWRGPDDIEWLEWLIALLGGPQLPPHVLHIEAIVWAALAMKMGGGYLDRTAWRCWRRSQYNRLQRLARVPGANILKSEPWGEIKCFHGGGEAKHWIPGAAASGLFAEPQDRTQFTSVSPFIELTPTDYERQQAGKRLLRRLGYYTLFRTA
jgi:hypothetical protein